jgi:hypothetical protein
VLAAFDEGAVADVSGGGGGVSHRLIKAQTSGMVVEQGVQM